MKRIIYIFLLILSVVASCKTGKISSSNLSFLYDKDMLEYIPQHVVYNVNDTVSRIYYRISSGSLLYVKELNEDHFSAKCTFHTELYDTYEMKNMLDSSTVMYVDDDNASAHNIDGSIEFIAPAGKNYLLKFIFNDLNKHTSTELFLDVRKSDPNSAQNFLLLDKDSLPAFTNAVDSAFEGSLLFNKKVGQFFVGYYDRIFPIAAPPYSSNGSKPFEYTPDSLFNVAAANGYAVNIKFPYKGFYHFLADTSQKSGFSIFRFYDDYPKITSADQMFPPLKYLSTKSEYDDMLMMKSKKEAVDKFWLEMAGNADRAREMIRLYYNRVQCANMYFTSYLEGWKTDRGIIYIIYGVPNVVYRSKDVETWIYGEDRNLLSMTFNFTRVENPFTDNDYSLSRSPSYKDGYFTAVETWRR